MVKKKASNDLVPHFESLPGFQNNAALQEEDNFII